MRHEDKVISIEISREGVLHKFETNVWYRTSMRSCDMLATKFGVQGDTLYAYGIDEDGRELSLPVSWLLIPSPLEQLAKASK